MGRVSNCALMGLLTALAATPAIAEDNQPGFFINPNISYYNFDSERRLEDSALPGLGLGYQFNSPWAVELNYLSKDVDFVPLSGVEVDFEQLRLDALYHGARNGNWQPYVAFGVGQNTFDFATGSIDETIINAGAGFKYYFTEALSLRGDARLINSMDEESQDLVLALGLNYLFGAKSGRPAAAPAPAPTPTPAPAPADADKDGVIDSLDRCPNTPANVAVDRNGCPLDSDGDGVPDFRDNCPNSERGARVDDAGCYIVIQETKNIELKINFANNSAEVPEEYVEQIKEVADFMNEYPLTKVVVEGHTDDRGQASYNQQLSERRAQAVAAVLVNRLGIAASRVSSVGKGEEEPIASNDTAEGRAANRRVVGVISATVETRAQ